MEKKLSKQVDKLIKKINKERKYYVYVAEWKDDGNILRELGISAFWDKESAMNWLNVFHINPNAVEIRKVEINEVPR